MSCAPSFSFTPHPKYPQIERLVVDGKVDEGSFVNLLLHGRRTVFVSETDVADRLFDMRCSELATHFAGVGLPVRDGAPVTEIYFYWCASEMGSRPRVYFSVPLDLRNWRRPWTPVEFVDTLAEVARDFADSEITVDQAAYLRNVSGVISFPLLSQCCSAREVLKTRLPIVLSVLDETSIRLASCPTATLVSETFTFLDGISIPAQRYLLYFTQFLADLGIGATSELKQGPGTVLFAVKPLSKDAALERIREALKLYLHLPTHPDFLEASAAFKNPAVVDLRAAVMDLRVQLASVKASLNGLRLSSGRRRGRARTMAELEEPLVGRFLTVKPYEGKWYKINLPLLLRSLKRTLRPRRLKKR